MASVDAAPVRVELPQVGELARVNGRNAELLAKREDDGILAGHMTGHESSVRSLQRASIRWIQQKRRRYPTVTESFGSPQAPAADTPSTRMGVTFQAANRARTSILGVFRDERN